MLRKPLDKLRVIQRLGYRKRYKTVGKVGQNAKVRPLLAKGWVGRVDNLSHSVKATVILSHIQQIPYKNC